MKGCITITPCSSLRARNSFHLSGIKEPSSGNTVLRESSGWIAGREEKVTAFLLHFVDTMMTHL